MGNDQNIPYTTSDTSAEDFELLVELSTSDQATEGRNTFLFSSQEDLEKSKFNQKTKQTGDKCKLKTKNLYYLTDHRPSKWVILKILILMVYLGKIPKQNT